VWNRWKNAKWKQTLAKGLAPVIVGLVWSSVFTIGKGVAHGAGAYAIAAVVTVLMLRTKLSAPALILLSGAAGIAVLR
jgi:chromate transporter